MEEKQPHPWDVVVGARVRAARTARGVSQTLLADHLGLTFQQVQKYERGSNRISASKLIEIGQVLQVAPSDFLKDLTTAEPGDFDFSLFTRPGVMELVQAFGQLSLRDQRAILQLTRTLSEAAE